MRAGAVNKYECFCSIKNLAGQVVETDDYFNLSGLTYSTATVHLGSTSNDSASGNYHKTKYHYDDLGRRDSVVDPTLTITRTVFDGLGRETSVWVGTDDNSTHQSDGTGTGDFDPLHPGNMVKTVDYQFDGGGVGNGDLTKITQHPGLGQADRVTVNLYDYRDRLTASEQAVGASDATPLLTTSTYDNLGEVTRATAYDGGQVSTSGLTGDNVAMGWRPTRPPCGHRRLHKPCGLIDHTGFGVDENRAGGADRCSGVINERTGLRVRASAPTRGTRPCILFWISF